MTNMESRHAGITLNYLNNYVSHVEKLAFSSSSRLKKHFSPKYVFAIINIPNPAKMTFFSPFLSVWPTREEKNNRLLENFLAVNVGCVV